MKNFKIIDNLPVLDLMTDLTNLLNSNKVYWGKDNQICINALPDAPDDFFAGCGSLKYDWDNSTTVTENGIEKHIVKKIENPKKETDFSVLCSAFYGTYFEELYSKLNSQFQVGRVRLMKSKPKTCLSWHVDSSPRIHYPIKTQEGCLMVIEDEVKHLEQNKWYWTNTTVPHTAFNASKEDRIHLVATILREK